MHPAGLRCSSLTYARYARSSRLAGRAPRRPEWRTYFRTGPKPAMCADCRPLEFPFLAVRIGARYTPKPSPAANLFVAQSSASETVNSVRVQTALTGAPRSEAFLRLIRLRYGREAEGGRCA